jgi:hypothetical protein
VTPSLGAETRRLWAASVKNRLRALTRRRDSEPREPAAMEPPIASEEAFGSGDGGSRMPS